MQWSTCTWRLSLQSLLSSTLLNSTSGETYRQCIEHIFLSAGVASCNMVKIIDILYMYMYRKQYWVDHAAELSNGSSHMLHFSCQLKLCSCFVRIISKASECTKLKHTTLCIGCISKVFHNWTLEVMSHTISLRILHVELK